MGKYILNKETQKIELHFDKAEYMALSDDQKKEIQRFFQWSRYANAWVSKSTKNHYWALKIAEKLGFEDGGKVGERLSYEEELNRKVERAEARAERYEEYAANAEGRARALQSVFDKHRGDIAFFTQPIIPGHAGSRAFASYREKLYRRYEKGFEEFEKSAYFRDRADTARATADNAKLKDRVYLHNRIKEQNKKIKGLQNYIVAVENNLYRILQGEELRNRYNGELITEEMSEKRIAELLEEYDYEQGKLEFFEKCLDDIGGIQFSKENIKVGFIVEVRYPGQNCEVVSAGPVNITYKILDGGAKGMVLTAPYAEIKKIKKASEKKQDIENPFTVGDILCHYVHYDSSRLLHAWQVIKVTKTGVKIQQIKVDDGKPIKDNFISEKQEQKKIVKSKYSDWVGVYSGDWQLHKYEEEKLAGAI